MYLDVWHLSGNCFIPEMRTEVGVMINLALFIQVRWKEKLGLNLEDGYVKLSLVSA